MNDGLRLSRDGLKLVKEFEGCLRSDGLGNFRAYVCPAGKLTIGWGHTNDHGRKFTGSSKWTQAECDASLAEDMRGFEAHVKRLVRVPLSQHQFDALVSFTYNCGDGALAGSTLLRKLNRGDYAGTEREFGKWVNGGGRRLPGLVRRRAAEARLFADGDQATPDPDDGVMPQRVDPPEPPKSMGSSKTGNTAIAIGAGSAAEIAASVNEHLDTATDLKDKADHLGLKFPTFDVFAFLSNPKVLILIAVIIGAAFIWWDRRRKLHEDQV